MRNTGLGDSKAGIQIARRNIHNLTYADDATLKAENKEELKILLKKVKEESEKAVLNLNIQKMKTILSSPFTSWQIDKKTKEIVTYFIFLSSKILQMVTAAMKLKDTCSLEEKLWPT